jgi:hypothetical protein
MGVDCSNCRCTNREDEKILIIDNSEKINNTKFEARRDKLESLALEKSKGVRKLNMSDLLIQNPNLLTKVVKLQSLIRKYRDRKTYKAILKKFRVKIIINKI